MREPCSECPFVLLSDEELAALRGRALQGGWVPCLVGLAVRDESKSLDHWIAQMRNEDECLGARIWRRDRRRP